jgi:hypothetical protein
MVEVTHVKQQRIFCLFLFFFPLFLSVFFVVPNQSRIQLEAYHIHCDNHPMRCDHDYLNRLAAMAEEESLREFTSVHSGGMTIEELPVEDHEHDFY